MNDLASNAPYADDPHGAADFAIPQPDGTFRVGGCLPRRWAPEASPFKPWGSTDQVPMVPKAEWVEQESLRGYETWQRDINQQSYPACCLASLANAMQFSMARDGRPVVELGWLAAWRKLSGGCGGVALDDAADYACNNGFPRLDGKGTVKIQEAWDCPSVEALASALQRGALCTFGHDVHAEHASRLVKQNGVWSLDVRNSWGRDWGDKGWHFLPLSKVEMRYSIIAIRELEYIGDDA